MSSCFDSDQEVDEEIGRDYKARETFNPANKSTIGNMSTADQMPEEEPDMNLAIDLLVCEIPRQSTEARI